VSWIFQAQDKNKCQAVVNKVTNIRAAQNAENFVTGRGYVSFSKRFPFQCRPPYAVRTFNTSLATGVGARYRYAPHNDVSVNDGGPIRL